MSDIIFTVEASPPPNRYKVSWEQDGMEHWFFAEIDGDQITRVLASAFSKNPTVTRRDPSRIRGALSSFNADQFGPQVIAATRAIRNGKLASFARAGRDREQAEREARLVAEKAATVRRIVHKNELWLSTSDGNVPKIDAILAKFYDDIQNAGV